MSVMIIVVPAPWSRAPGAWFKKEILPDAAPKPVLLSLSRERIWNISGHKTFK